MTAFPKHPAYKDSGVEWLGEVPEHWGVDPLRACAELSTERNRSDLPVLSVYREYGVIPKDSRDDNHNATSLDTSNYKVIRPGDLAVNKMKAWQGSLGVSKHHGIVSPAYITCRIDQDKVNGRYLHYLLRSRPLVGALDAISYGVRVGQWDMRWEDFKLVQLTYPPRAEQDRIVAFLDEKTAQIDALIAKKQRQIELLDEQKAILINRAVTRGLHPNPDLQNSGIPWIGPIPKHWKPVALRRLVLRIEQGVSPSTVEGDVGPQDWGVLKSGCTNGGVFRETEHKRLPKRFKIDPSIVVRSGDLLVSRACGSRDLVASTALVEDLHFNLILSDKNFRLVLGDAVLPRFLCHSMNSWHYRRQIEPRISGAEGLPNNIPSSRLVEVVIPLPDLEEQKAVIAHLDSLHHGFNKLSQQIESQIQTLQTLRSTLIAHAVTGKIKV